MIDSTLSAILGKGLAYCLEGVQTEITDTQTEITGGDVVVKKYCAHIAGEPTVENEVATDCDTAGSYCKVTRCTIYNGVVIRETITIDALAILLRRTTATAPRLSTALSATLRPFRPRTLTSIAKIISVPQRTAMPKTGIYSVPLPETEGRYRRELLPAH